MNGIDIDYCWMHWERWNCLGTAAAAASTSSAAVDCTSAAGRIAAPLCSGWAAGPAGSSGLISRSDDLKSHRKMC